MATLTQLSIVTPTMALRLACKFSKIRSMLPILFSPLARRILKSLSAGSKEFDIHVLRRAEIIQRPLRRRDLLPVRQKKKAARKFNFRTASRLFRGRINFQVMGLASAPDQVDLSFSVSAGRCPTTMIPRSNRCPNRPNLCCRAAVF